MWLFKYVGVDGRSNMRLRTFLKLKWVDGTNRQLTVRFRQQLCRGFLLVAIFCATIEMAVAQNYLTQTGSPTFASAWPVELG